MLERYERKVRQIFNQKYHKEFHNFHHLVITAFSFILVILVRAYTLQVPYLEEC